VVLLMHIYVDGESGIEAGYLRDLSICYMKEEGHNVRLVKAAINILVDIEGSINNDTSDPLHIQQKSRKRSGNDAAVSNIPIRADSDNVSSQVGELQNQLSRERDSSTQITAQAGASIRLLENYIERDGAIHNNNISTLEDTVARRDVRIQELEGELNNTPNANQYLQITELENQVAEQSNQITELRDGLATQEASHQAIVNDLQVRLGSATSKGDTLSAEVVQLRDTLTTLETDYTNLHAQLGDLIDENIDLELSKTVAEDHRDDLIEQVSELTMESLAKDHAFELSRQGHDEELERLQYIHLAELQHEADRAGLELEQTQAESRGDAARAAERAESVVYRVKAEAREQVSSVLLFDYAMF
jgi:chromosome segregation ATPase